MSPSRIISIILCTTIGLSLFVAYHKQDIPCKQDTHIMMHEQGSYRHLPGSDPQSLLRLEQLFYTTEHREHIHTSQQLFAKVNTAMPQMTDALKKLANILSHQGRPDDAYATYRAASTINPSNYSTFMV